MRTGCLRRSMGEMVVECLQHLRSRPASGCGITERAQPAGVNAKGVRRNRPAAYQRADPEADGRNPRADRYAFRWALAADEGEAVVFGEVGVVLDVEGGQREALGQA